MLFPRVQLPLQYASEIHYEESNNAELSWVKGQSTYCYKNKKRERPLILNVTELL